MRKILLVLCLFVLGFGLFGCGNESEYDKQIKAINSVSRDEQFIVGLECAYEPFNWTEDKATASNVAIYNVSGKFAEGYDIQMAKKIAEALGKTLVVKAIEWDSLIPSLDSKHIDAVIAGMSATDDRRKSVSFTDAYYTSQEVCIVLKNSKYASATSINDFNGATAIGQAGTLYADLVNQLVGANVSPSLKTVPDIVTAMMNGRCDVTVVEKPVALGLCASNADLAIVEFSEGNGFTVSEEDVAVCIANRLSDVSLTTSINDILKNITLAEREALMAEAVNR